MEKPKMPPAQIYYGEIVYWLCLVSAAICAIGPVVTMLSPDHNVMNPFFLFSGIWEGKSAQEIWTEVAGGFPGGHFYLRRFTHGDGITQFGIALGCACALPALLGAAVAYMREKPRAYLWAGLACWVAFLIGYSMTSGGPPSH
jgi:hypothetical protein